MGCNGGNPASALNYVVSHKLDTEASYPYKGVGGSCKAAKTPTGHLSKGAKSVAASDSAMITAINTQPVSVAIEADKRYF